MKLDVFRRLSEGPGPSPAYSFTRLNEPDEETARLFGILILEEDEDGDASVHLTSDDVTVQPIWCEHCKDVRATKIYEFQEDDGEDVEWELCDSCYERETTSS
jgi:hypothetical protein